MAMIVTNLNVWQETSELQLLVPVLFLHCPGHRAPRLPLATHPGEALTQALCLAVFQSFITKEVPANICPTCFMGQIKSSTGHHKADQRHQC